MKTFEVRVIDARHYDYLKGAGLEEKTATAVKALQMPTPQGVWEAVEISGILKGRGVSPTFIGHSPQPRAEIMARMIARTCGWRPQLKALPGLNDLGSDPNSKPIMPLITAFAKENGCSVEEAIIRQDDAKQYIFNRSHARLQEIIEVAKVTGHQETIFLCSHGGSIEPTAIRFLLIKNGTPLEEQKADMLNVNLLEEYGGMLRTGEAYVYNLKLGEDKLGEDGSVDVKNIYSYRIPKCPFL